MPAPISPAPMSSTRRPSNEPRRSRAIITAACDTDVVWRAIDVSVRARLPTSTAWRNSKLSPARGRALALGPLPRHSHLPENLAFAEHGRVDTRGHREQMTGGDVVVEGIEVVGERLGRRMGQVAQEVAYVLVRAVEALGDGVDLGAIARGEHDRFTDVGARRQIMQRLGRRSSETIIRSSNSSGTVRWFRPMTTIDTPYEPFPGDRSDDPPDQKQYRPTVAVAPACSLIRPLPRCAVRRGGEAAARSSVAAGRRTKFAAQRRGRPCAPTPRPGP